MRHLPRFVLALSFAGVVAAGVTLAEPQASAQQVEVRIAPPVARAEYVPRRPTARHTWVRGYWVWEPGAGYVWAPGRWVAAEPGYAWEEPRWEHRGRAWHFTPGRWHHR